MHPRIRISAIVALVGVGGLAVPALADIYAPASSTPAPVIDHSVSAYGDTYYVEEPIIVTAPEESEDALITRDVVDAIGSDPRIPGEAGTAIGVYTYDRDVTLTGRVVTPRQAEIASEDAHSVDGARNVDNYIRARVGES